MSSNGDLEWWGAGTLPPPLAIVWCNFPDRISPEKPGPKQRPALVLKSRYAENIPNDRFAVFVAYGTSKLKTNTRPHDFIISNFVTRRLCRLPQGTRFDLDSVLWLPWAKPYFVPREGDTTPVISTLPSDLQREFGWHMKARDELGLNDHLYK